MASTTMTLHVELSGLDRDLLERTCENLEWYRKHLQEQAQVQQEREAQMRHGAMIAHEAKEQEIQKWGASYKVEPQPL